MAVSKETRAFVLELFENIPELTTRAMMGGLAIYSRGRIFAIVGLGERIFLKAKATFADQLAAEGAEQFAYSRSGKLAKMGYWTLPDQALDDPELACGWARRALEASDPDFPDAAPLLAGGEFVGR